MWKKEYTCVCVSVVGGWGGLNFIFLHLTWNKNIDVRETWTGPGRFSNKGRHFTCTNMKYLFSEWITFRTNTETGKSRSCARVRDPEPIFTLTSQSAGRNRENPSHRLVSGNQEQIVLYIYVYILFTILNTHEYVQSS